MQDKKSLKERLKEALEKGHISESDARAILKLAEIED